MLENSNSKNKLTKFRISVHDLEIEKGRYKNIPADKRFCKLCNKNVIEDEIHFLLQCPSLSQERSTFVSDLSSRYPNYCTLDNKSKFIWLMSNEDNYINKKLINLINNLFSANKAKYALVG